jgi:hypothetical protein
MSQTECSTPKCSNKRLETRRFCGDCQKNLDRIREEFENDPLLLYNQRSDTRDDTRFDRARKPKPPVCRFVGCFEIREKDSVFCFAHENEGNEAA